MIAIGNLQIDALFFGNLEIKSMWLGTTKIYEQYNYTVQDGVITINNAPYSVDGGVITIL